MQCECVKVCTRPRARACVWVRAEHLCVGVHHTPSVGVTHSCTAGHAFSAGSCCRASRWHSWRKSRAPGGGGSLPLLPPPLQRRPPRLSAGPSLGSYPAGEQTQGGLRGCEPGRGSSGGVHLLFAEGAGHPAPQRAQRPPDLGALLHLLGALRLVLVPAHSHARLLFHCRGSRRSTGERRRSGSAREQRIKEELTRWRGTRTT